MERLLEARAPQRRISLGLERIHDALAFYGRPDRRYPAVIVSGTKGKGSTAAFLAHSLRALGLRIGLYTSPHLQCVGERVLMNHRMIPADRLRDLLRDILNAVDRGRIPELSYFEILTVLAARYFAEENAEFVVWEVGIGGRLDATNAFARIGAVTTSISMDHRDILGPTLRGVAREKLAVHESAAFRVVGEQRPAVRYLLGDFLQPHSYWLFGRDFSATPTTESIDGSSFVYFGGGISANAEIRQPGRFQVHNAAAALAFIQQWHDSIPRTVLAALPDAFWPGRMETLSFGSSFILMDGAHNAYSAQVLVANLRRQFPATRWTVLFSSQSTKDYARMIRALTPIAQEFIFTTAPGSPHPAEPSDLARFCRLPSRLLSPQDLCSTLQPGNLTTSVLVTGSLYLVGAVRTVLNLAPLARSGGSSWPGDLPAENTSCEPFCPPLPKPYVKKAC